MTAGSPASGVSPPRVTRIIPAYNAETFVREAIDSALGQSLPPCEVIVVDDESTDRTAEIVAALPPPVRLLRQAHAMQRAARNLGARAATGELLAFLDADDIWEPDKLRIQVELLRASPPGTAVFAHAQNFWSGELEEQGNRLRDAWVARPFAALFASTMLVSRELFDRLGQFDVRLQHGEVADWLERAKAAGVPVAVHPATLVRRRIHATNMSRTTGSRDDFLVLLQQQIEAKRRAGLGDAPRPTHPPE
jgi:glycosyltransferase involved in cell wall biosynthesis